ncbi:MAG: hypothetical protein IPG32_04910 [Saprospirales bacterium]|nr:hypothetical protein [Saprospirales bacterium]
MLIKESYQYELFGAADGFSKNRVVRTLQQDGYEIVELVRLQPVHMSEGGSSMSGETREYTVEGIQHARLIRKGEQEMRYLYNCGGQITDIFQKNGRISPHRILLRCPRP